MSIARPEVAVIGGGIVGLATAVALAKTARVTVLEKETRIAAHQTGRNSGVIHSGLYYRPGSAKARLCTAGRQALDAFCQVHEIPYERCGKLVVALDEPQRQALDELERRGRANGLTGLKRLDADGIREHEPHASGIDGLWVEETGIVDYPAVCRALLRCLEDAGGRIRLGFQVEQIERRGAAWRVASDFGEVVEAAGVVNCAGLMSDVLARRCGHRPSVRIIPFRGEYYALRPHRRSLVRNLIYPVPDPSLPFLGVHLTRRVDGMVEAGPNAVLAFRREGYRFGDVSPRDLASTLSWPGFWRLARRHGRTGWAEMRRSLSRRRFAADLARLVPEIRPEDLEPAGSGVRAQAVWRNGKMCDDFHIVEDEKSVHVLNAPSPAATASLAIGESVAERMRAQLELNSRG